MSANLSTRLQSVYKRIDRHKSGLKVMVLEHSSEKEMIYRRKYFKQGWGEKIFKAASECSGAIDNE